MLALGISPGKNALAPSFEVVTVRKGEAMAASTVGS
jgi:hypothetical protein